MQQWIHLCFIADAPADGQITEAEAAGVTLCLARLHGTLHALDNLCPHRQGPLGQGWIEGDTVVCPWHSWSFSLTTGKSDFPPSHQVRTYPLSIEGSSVVVQLDIETGESIPIPIRNP